MELLQPNKILEIPKMHIVAAHFNERRNKKNSKQYYFMRNRLTEANIQQGEKEVGTFFQPHLGEKFV